MIDKDKELHFAVSLAITLLAFRFIGWWAVPATLFIGVCKEVYDWFSYGLFSWDDIRADFHGIAGASLIILLIKLITL